MVLLSYDYIEISTERFLLREMTEAYVTSRYLDWFKDTETKKFIEAAPNMRNLKDLKDYINARKGRKDVLFLGIFDKICDLHIGTIKFEPINLEKGYAIVGVMIGENQYRGIGAATEVLKASTSWLRENRGIHLVALGVSKNNRPAIIAYKRAGFLVSDKPNLFKVDSDGLMMICRL